MRIRKEISKIYEDLREKKFVNFCSVRSDLVRAWILKKWTKYYLDANFIFNPLKAAVEWESRVTKRRYSIISEWRKRVRGLEKEDIERFKGARWNFFFFYLVFKKIFCPFIN